MTAKIDKAVYTVTVQTKVEIAFTEADVKALMIEWAREQGLMPVGVAAKDVNLGEGYDNVTSWSSLTLSWSSTETK